MRLEVPLLAGFTLLAGCVQDVGPAGDMLARDVAKGVVNNAVQDQFPGVNARPLTDCIIDNASAGEILQIAEAALLGANQQTTDLIVSIAQRPQTVRCSVNSSLGLNL